MPDFNKPQPVDPLRKKRNELSTHIKQEVSGLFTKLEKQGGIIEYGSDGIETVNFSDEFELEGRDDVVKAVIQQEDVEACVVTISVMTECEGEEEEHDLGELSIDDQLNVYEALKELVD